MNERMILERNIEILVTAVCIANTEFLDLTDRHFDIDSTPMRLMYGEIRRDVTDAVTRDELRVKIVNLINLHHAICSCDIAAIVANQMYIDNRDFTDPDDDSPHEINFDSDTMCMISDLRECVAADRFFDAADHPDYTVYST